MRKDGDFLKKPDQKQEKDPGQSLDDLIQKISLAFFKRVGRIEIKIL